MALRSGNPALRADSFTNTPAAATGERSMTLGGTANKALALIGLVLLGATWTWYLFFNAATTQAGMQTVMPWIIGSLIGGLVTGLICTFVPKAAMVLAPIYAGCEGLLLGGLSAITELRFPGIVVQAVALTLGVFVCLLVLYKTRIIRATENFKLGVTAATASIFLIYLATMVLHWFGVQVPYIHEAGLIGIGFSLFVVVIASLNLVLDFDYIEQGVERNAPRYMEWYAAFALLVTLVWLYLEILRLLSKLRSR